MKKTYPLVEQKERERQEKLQNEKFCCPRCKSDFVHFEKQGFDIVAGAIGAAVFEDLIAGALIGSANQDKIVATCFNCGHKWKL